MFGFTFSVVDNCETRPCSHGICENAIGKYKCICNVGYTGTHCETGKW